MPVERARSQVGGGPNRFARECFPHAMHFRIRAPDNRRCFRIGVLASGAAANLGAVLVQKGEQAGWKPALPGIDAPNLLLNPTFETGSFDEDPAPFATKFQNEIQPKGDVMA